MWSVAEEGRWIATEVPFDRQARAEWLRGFVENADDASFVAVVDDAIVGMLGLERTRYGVLDLGMFVAPAWREKGVGSALMTAALEWARTTDAHKVSLEYFPHNDAARRLYERFGFAEEGRKRRHYRRAGGELWDGVLMGFLLDEE